MIDILTKYSLSQIIIFAILLILALKSMFSFFEWAKAKIMTIAKRENRYQQLQNMIAEEKRERKQELNAIHFNLSGLSQFVEKITQKIDLLLQSDRDDIKSFITRQYNYFVLQKKQIDHYSLQAIEKRYAHYVEEGGNSFVENMMIALRQLPRKHDKIEH